MRFHLAVLLFVATSSFAGEPVAKDLVPECPAPPYPTDPIGPVFSNHVLTTGSSASARFRLWRLPCTDADSLFMVTVTPVTGSPFVCSDFSMVQNSVQYDATATRTPESGNFCANVLSEVTLLVRGRPVPGLPSFDPDAAFEFANSAALQGGPVLFPVPAYDPTLYGLGGNRLVIKGALSGAWYNPLRAGEGVLVDVAQVEGRTVLFIAWFTYLDGQQQWIAGNVDLGLGDREATLPLIRGTGGDFGAAFDPTQINFEPWGEAFMYWDSCNSLTIVYEGPNGVMGTLTLQRLVGNLAGVACP